MHETSLKWKIMIKNLSIDPLQSLFHYSYKYYM